MSEKCGNCIFGQAVEGLSKTKRVCKNKAGQVDWWHLVAAGDHCDNYCVSHVAMMRAGSDDKKYKGARLIALSKGMFTIVDECDFAELSRYNWLTYKAPRNFYAVRAAGKKQPRMHRVITAAAAGMVVDHIDNDGLNNRRSNLRICTIKQNSRNARGHKGTSKYKGVSWDKRHKKWRAKIVCNGKGVPVGCFEDEMDAARAYDKHAKELFGEYAYLNFPPH